MTWSTELVAYYFAQAGSEDRFESEYCGSRTLAGADKDVAAIKALRLICKCLAEAIPHGIHTSPGFSLVFRPWLVLSRITGAGGRTSPSRVVMIQNGAAMYLGFQYQHAQNGAAGTFMQADLHDLVMRHDWQGISPQWVNLGGYEQGGRKRTHRCLQVKIPGPALAGHDEGLSLETGPLRALLEAIDAALFVDQRQVVDFPVITPRIKDWMENGRPQAGAPHMPLGGIRGEQGARLVAAANRTTTLGAAVVQSRPVTARAAANLPDGEGAGDMPARSVSELAERLRDPAIGVLARGYFNITALSLEEAILVSVDASTIRAYHNTRRYRPSSLFRSWADAETRSDWNGRLASAAQGLEAYREFHADLCTRLQAYWAIHDEPDGAGAQRSSVPNYGRARKLVDLFMKHVLLVSGLDAEVRERLRFLIHVPLDKYTLKHLSGVSKEGKSIALPINRWTMGTTSIDNYLPLQDLIRDVAEAAQVAPIDFDIYAWNAEHKQVTQGFITRWSNHTAGGPEADSEWQSRLRLVPKEHSGVRDWKWLGRKRRGEKQGRV